VHDQPPGAVQLAALRDRLRRLHRAAGEPSSREVARLTGKAISHTTANITLRCDKSPKWGQLELVVDALGGDTEEFRQLWVSVRDAENASEDSTRWGASVDNFRPNVKESKVTTLGESDLNPRATAPNSLTYQGTPAVANAQFKTFTVSKRVSTVAAIIMIGWGKFKERVPEDYWLHQLCFIYDQVEAAARESGLMLTCKFLNNGALLSSESNTATEMLNLVIRIQEELVDGFDLTKERIRYAASLSTGQLLEIFKADGHYELAGCLIDRAFRLCALANENVIFVDQHTAAVVNVNRIYSNYGGVVERTSGEYIGDAGQVHLKGESSPVKFYEILWHRERYGVASTAITSGAIEA
jgi:hypothetical protein